MKLTRYRTPWTPSQWAHSLGRDFDNLLADFYGEEVDLPAAGFTPKVDIAETEEAYVVKAEVPGIERKDLQVEVKENVLVLSGERKMEKDEQKENYRRIERSYGAFTRSFALPHNVDNGKVGATMENGVLVVTLPKTTVSRATTVDIH